MESSGKKCKVGSICSKLGLRPLTRDNILYYYVPLQGMASFAALSVNSMNPNLMTRVFGQKDVTGVLLVSSMVGTGLYLYDRPHIRAAPTQLKFSYSVYGSLLFNFGSLLLFAVAKSYLPENTNVATLVGFLSCYSLVKVGTSYLEHIDSQTKKN